MIRENPDIKKTLMVFTNNYPYGQSEQFLEDEVIHLARRFQRISLIPAQIHGPARTLPRGIDVDTSLAKYLSLGGFSESYKLARSTIWSMRSALFYKELQSEHRRALDIRAFKDMTEDLYLALKTCKWVLGNIRNGVSPHNSTIFYSYWFNGSALGLILAKKKHPGMKVISRAHGYDFVEERRVVGSIPFRRYEARHIDKLFINSRYGKQYLEKTYCNLVGKIEIAMLGTEDPGFDTLPSTDGIFRIVSCSFVTPVKRIDLLIRGLAKLAKLRPELRIRWDHIGDGPLMDMHQDMARCELSQLVDYRFQGYLRHESIFDYFQSNPVDVFVNTSAFEGIPVTIMEAQSCGIPVLATSVGGSPEIVDSENGMLLGENPSPEDIARALQEFCDGGKAMMAKRAKSKENWRQNFNAAINYNHFADDLSQL